MQSPSPSFLAAGPRRGKGRRRPGAALGPSGRSPSGQTPAPERQCLVCRTRRPQPALLQLLVTPQGPEVPGRNVPDARATYVCVRRACLTAAAKRTAEPEVWLQRVAALATARFGAMLGLGRRQGQLLVGAGRITDPKVDPEGVAIYAAADAAARTRQQLGEDAVDCMLTCQGLGQAVGTRDVAAIGFLPGQLSQRAAYWQRVWYEARRLDLDPATNGSTPDRRRIEVAR